MFLRMRRTARTIALTLSLGILLSACGSSSSNQTKPAQTPAAPAANTQPAAPTGDPIKLGFLSIFSGRLAMLGETGFKGAKLAVQEINEKGGIMGRKVEIRFKDTTGNRDEAVRIARDYVLKDKVNFLIDGSSSAESFAVSQVAKQLSVLSFATASEAASLTAKENLHDFIFRAARNTTHDGVAAAQFAKGKSWTKWYTISPDYEYGRSLTDIFLKELKAQKDGVTLMGESWPKLFEPDYTPHIQKILDAKPEAVYSALWGGDLVAFIKQAKPFGLFDKVVFVCPNVADSLVLTALGGELPAGIVTGTRWIANVPKTEVNEKFGKAYANAYGENPTNWSVQAYQAIYILKAAIEKAGDVDSKKVSATLAGLEVKNLPWGDLQIRGSDHQLVNYTIGWGATDPKDEFKVKAEMLADWKQILEREQKGIGSK